MVSQIFFNVQSVNHWWADFSSNSSSPVELMSCVLVVGNARALLGSFCPSFSEKKPKEQRKKNKYTVHKWDGLALGSTKKLIPLLLLWWIYRWGRAGKGFFNVQSVMQWGDKFSSRDSGPVELMSCVLVGMGWQHLKGSSSSPSSDESTEEGLVEEALMCNQYQTLLGWFQLWGQRLSQALVLDMQGHY